MSEMKLFDRTIGLLGKVLDLRHKQQELIASNIANAETPGYTPVRLSFEEDLSKALENRTATPRQTDPRHIAITATNLETVQGHIERRPDKEVSVDGNGVDLDKQLINQSQNQLLYETAAQILNKKLAMLKYASQDGR